MKKPSARAVSALTNLALSLILIAVAVVCFLPYAPPAAKLEEGVWRKGNSEDGVSLMINVYWGTDIVYQMLDVLDDYGARATFFLGGSWADDNVDCVKEIASRGHEIGSHGYFHRSHDTLDYAANVQEIRTSVEFLSLIIKRPVTLFAPPSGAYSEDTLSACRALGLKAVLWSKDTVDWRDKEEALCLTRATEDVSGGDLILMHPMEHTLRALPKILESYAERGLRAVTVGENLG